MQTIQSGANEALNTLGTKVLELLGYQLIGILTAALYIVFGTIHAIRRRKWPELRESIAAILGILSVFSGVIIFCVFDLTNPPAVDKIPEDSRGLIGLVCGVVLAVLGSGEFFSVFFGRKALVPSSVPVNPPPTPGQSPPA